MPKPVLIRKQLHNCLHLTNKEREAIIRILLAQNSVLIPSPVASTTPTPNTAPAQYEYYIRGEGRALRSRIPLQSFFYLAGEYRNSSLNIDEYMTIGNVVGTPSHDQDISPAVANLDGDEVRSMIVQQGVVFCYDAWFNTGNLPLERTNLQGVAWRMPTKQTILKFASALSRSAISAINDPEELIRVLRFNHEEYDFLFPDDYEKIRFGGWELCHGSCWASEYGLSEQTVKILKILRKNMCK